MTKICKTCKLNKPASQFYTNGKYLFSNCKECIKHNQNKFYKYVPKVKIINPKIYIDLCYDLISFYKNQFNLSPKLLKSRSLKNLKINIETLKQSLKHINFRYCESCQTFKSNSLFYPGNKSTCKSCLSSKRIQYFKDNPDKKQKNYQQKYDWAKTHKEEHRKICNTYYHNNREIAIASTILSSLRKKFGIKAPRKKYKTRNLIEITKEINKLRSRGTTL